MEEAETKGEESAAAPAPPAAKPAKRGGIGAELFIRNEKAWIQLSGRNLKLSTR